LEKTTLKLTIPGELTSLNDYIRAERAHRRKGAAIKRDETLRCYYAALGMEPLPDVRYDVMCVWFCRNQLTDPDNIAFAVKYVLDGMQQAGVLPGDGWKNIATLHHVFRVDAEEPRVEVDFEPEVPRITRLEET
jgi:hypothetical protein